MESERKSRYELFLEEQEKPKEKRCSRCRKVKALNEYYKEVSAPLGVASACKQCLSRRKYRSRDDRFWKTFHSKTEQIGGCLEWTGTYTDKQPVCEWQGRTVAVRRIVYRLALGELPDDMCVIVLCCNPRCVRQSHLKKATREEVEIKRRNSAAVGAQHWTRIQPERIARGPRPFASVARGEQHHSAKLTAEKVREMRERAARGEGKRSLARAFGVSLATVLCVLCGKTWAHVQ